MDAEEPGELLERFRSPELRGGFGDRAGLALVVAAGSLVALAIGTVNPALAAIVVVSLVVAWRVIRTSVGGACVEAYEKGIVVRNPLSTVWIPWQAVENVRGGGRLRIERHDTGPVLAYAVGNSNFGGLVGKVGYADEVARTLLHLRDLNSS